jgi:hypothetical protein
MAASSILAAIGDAGLEKQAPNHARPSCYVSASFGRVRQHLERQHQGVSAIDAPVGLGVLRHPLDLSLPSRARSLHSNLCITINPLHPLISPNSFQQTIVNISNPIHNTPKIQALRQSLHPLCHINTNSLRVLFNGMPWLQVDNVASRDAIGVVVAEEGCSIRWRWGHCW